MQYAESGQVESSEINQVLDRWTSGHAEVGELMVSLVYCDLHRLAESYERESTVDPSDVADRVRDAYLQLFGAKAIRWQNHCHFLTVAARIMRLVLVRYCERLEQTESWGKISLAETDLTPANSRFGLEIAPIRPPHLLALNEAIQNLEKVDNKLARVVELRFFAGLSLDGIAECMETSHEAVGRLWRQARAWLRDEAKQYQSPERVH